MTYWLAPGRRVVLLTVFHKTRSAETAGQPTYTHSDRIHVMPIDRLWRPIPLNTPGT